MESLDDIFAAIVREIGHQNQKYGVPEERQLTEHMYLLIAKGEMREVENELRMGQPEKARAEALQAITVLVQWIKFHGLVQEVR